MVSFFRCSMHDPTWQGGAKHEASDAPNVMLLWDASGVDGRVEAGTCNTGGEHKMETQWKSARWNGRMMHILVRGKFSAKPYLVVFADGFVPLIFCSTCVRRHVFHSLDEWNDLTRP